MPKIIAVNAIALTYNGALTILNQFINNSINHNIIIFINHELKNHYQDTPNIRFVAIENQSFFSRIKWDFYGMKAWLKKNNIKPSTIISLQNTSVNFSKNTTQVIYFHQGIMLDDTKWSLLNPKQIRLAFYKYIYPFFVFMFNHKNTYFVVQSNWVKEALHQKFTIPLKKILIIKPSIPKIVINSITTLPLKHKLSLFYPTSCSVHKNYTEILNALIYLKNNYSNISDIALYITIDKNSDRSFYEQVKQNNLENNIIFLGHLSYEQTLTYYKSCTALVYPSLIETFGLPLVEAAVFHKPIITVNKSYAKETLDKYNNAQFLEPGDNKAWAQAILNIKATDQQCEISNYSTNWKTLFEFVDNVTE